MKTDSERLNSAAMACFLDEVRWCWEEAGMLMMASGLPSYGVRVKTSRVTKERISILNLDY